MRGRRPYAVVLGLIVLVGVVARARVERLLVLCRWLSVIVGMTNILLVTAPAKRWRGPVAGLAAAAVYAAYPPAVSVERHLLLEPFVNLAVLAGAYVWLSPREDRRTPAAAAAGALLGIATVTKLTGGLAVQALVGPGATRPVLIGRRSGRVAGQGVARRRTRRSLLGGAVRDRDRGRAAGAGLLRAVPRRRSLRRGRTRSGGWGRCLVADPPALTSEAAQQTDRSALAACRYVALGMTPKRNGHFSEETRSWFTRNYRPVGADAEPPTLWCGPRPRSRPGRHPSASGARPGTDDDGVGTRRSKECTMIAACPLESVPARTRLSCTRCGTHVLVRSVLHQPGGTCPTCDSYHLLPVREGRASRVDRARGR